MSFYEMSLYDPEVENKIKYSCLMAMDSSELQLKLAQYFYLIYNMHFHLTFKKSFSCLSMPFIQNNEAFL